MGHRWFHDPDILALVDNESATSTRNHQRIPSVSAGLRHEIGLGYLEETFFQGKGIERILLVEQKGGIPGLQRGQILHLEVEVSQTVSSRQRILGNDSPVHSGVVSLADAS